MKAGSKTLPLKLAFVPHQLRGQPWVEGVCRDIETALAGAKLAGAPTIEVECADPCGRPAEQIAILKRCLKQPVDALIVLPIDPLTVHPILRGFREAGIPVIVVGNVIEDPDLFNARILGDQRQFGREVGEFFAATMKGEGDLIEMAGIEVNAITRDRSAGFQEVLARYPRMRIVDTYYGDWLYEKAYREFPMLLNRHKQLDGVYAHNDEMAAAVLEVARQCGCEEDLLVVGIDAVPSAMKLVNEGRQAATFLNPSPGKDAVYALQALLNGEPCMKQVLLKTWAYQSNARIKEWQKRRGKKGVSVSTPEASLRVAD
jgi:ribose transport system substrate-binding protein